MKNKENIFDVYEIKQSLNNALDHNGDIMFPDAHISFELRMIVKELKKETVDIYSLKCFVHKLDELLVNDYLWWRFYRLNEKLNELFNLGLTLRDRPQI